MWGGGGGVAVPCTHRCSFCPYDFVSFSSAPITLPGLVGPAHVCQWTCAARAKPGERDCFFFGVITPWKSRRPPHTALHGPLLPSLSVVRFSTSAPRLGHGRTCYHRKYDAPCCGVVTTVDLFPKRFLPRRPKMLLLKTGPVLAPGARINAISLVTLV